VIASKVVSASPDTRRGTRGEYFIPEHESGHGVTPTHSQHNNVQGKSALMYRVKQKSHAHVSLLNATCLTNTQVRALQMSIAPKPGYTAMQAHRQNAARAQHVAAL